MCQFKNWHNRSYISLKCLSIIQMSCNCHAHCIKRIAAADDYKKFNHWHNSWNLLFAISICFSSSRYGNASCTSSKMSSSISSCVSVDIVFCGVKIWEDLHLEKGITFALFQHYLNQVCLYVLIIMDNGGIWNPQILSNS